VYISTRNCQSTNGLLRRIGTYYVPALSIFFFCTLARFFITRRAKAMSFTIISIICIGTMYPRGDDPNRLPSRRLAGNHIIVLPYAHIIYRYIIERNRRSIKLKTKHWSLTETLVLNLFRVTVDGRGAA